MEPYRYRPERVAYMKVELSFSNSRQRQRGTIWLKGYGASSLIPRGATEISAILEDTPEMRRDLLRLPGVVTLGKERID